MVQWLRLYVSNAGGSGLIPGWGTKILHAAWCSQKNKTKQKTPTEQHAAYALIF